MDNSFVEKLVKELKVEIARGEAFLGDGSAKDYAEYREMVGKLTGVRVSLMLVQDLYGSAAKEDF